VELEEHDTSREQASKILSRLIIHGEGGEIRAGGAVFVLSRDRAPNSDAHVVQTLQSLARAMMDTKGTVPLVYFVFGQVPGPFLYTIFVDTWPENHPSDELMAVVKTIQLATFSTMTAMLAEAWNVNRTAPPLGVSPQLHPERYEAVIITLIEGAKKRVMLAIIDPQTRKLGPFEEGANAKITGRMIP